MHERKTRKKETRFLSHSVKRFLDQSLCYSFVCKHFRTRFFIKINIFVSFGIRLIMLGKLKDILILAILPHFLIAQDIHFSQFYASPLNLNPALAGVIEGNYRLAAVYRNQWASISKDAPFITAGGSFDINIPLENIKDIPAAGINMVTDQAGDGKLGMMHLSLTTAYHKKLDKNARHFLGIGLQPALVQRRISPNDLLFPNQFDGNILNKDRPNGENFGNTTFFYFDLNTGIIYSGRISPRIGITQGFSLFHLTRPQETFIGDETARLQRRVVCHGGLRLKATDNIVITPHYLFQYQNQARETNFGSAIEFHLHDKRKNSTIFSIGGWYRLHDAAITSMSIEYKKLRIGASYDFNISDLKPASRLRGGYELTLIYTGTFVKQDIGPLLVPCPRL